MPPVGIRRKRTIDIVDLKLFPESVRGGVEVLPFVGSDHSIKGASKFSCFV
jgi:hypothetical protein